MLLLEGRLEFFLTRINFVPTKYFAKQVMTNKGIIISDKIVTDKNYVLKPFEILSISPEQFPFLFFSLLDRLSSGRVVINYPSYIEVDYTLLQAAFIKYPAPKEIILPVSIEMDMSNRTPYYIYNQI